MKIIKLKSIIIILVLLVSASIANAQKRDFSGNWMLKDQQSISGQLYDNGVPSKMKIVQNSDKIKVEKTTLDKDEKDILTNEILLVDGKPSETITPSKRKKVIIMRWSADEKSFTTTTTLYNAEDNSKVDFKMTDTWTFDNAANLLMTRKSENFVNGEVWESKAEYEKQ